MKMLSGMFTRVLPVALMAFAGAANADHTGAGGTAPWTSPVCSAGPTGDRPAGMDADGDGVVDSEDWCPMSAAGERVGSNGCAAWEIPVHCAHVAQAVPARVVPVEKVAPLAAGTPDADHDGVPDSEDKCPGTTRGAEVDANGCVKIEKVVLKGVNFATGSSKLLPAASGTLRTVASAMKANGKIKVEVGGYTDSVGEDAKNLALSERRAKSVKTFLVNEGVAADRLSTKGFGKANPADTNDTPAGRANNRRVEFKLTAS